MSTTEPIPLPAPATPEALVATTSKSSLPNFPLQPHPSLVSLLPSDLPAFSTLRVTQHGKMSAQIQYAHTQLLLPKPIILHTFPPHSTNSTSTIPTSQITNSIPRLVSTTEILKRTFSTHLVALRREASKTKANFRQGDDGKKWWFRSQGLYQWTRLTTVEEIGLASDKEEAVAEGTRDDDRVMMDWLTGGAEGKKGSRGRPAKHTPLMIVVLSPIKLEAFEEHKEFTYQPPPPLPRNKAKKNKKRSAEVAEIEVDETEATAPIETSTSTGLNKDGATEGEQKRKKPRLRKKKKKLSKDESGPAATTDAGRGMDLEPANKSHVPAVVDAEQ